MPELQVIFFDVGQGDCTLIVYPDNSLTLVDCGSIRVGDDTNTGPMAHVKHVIDGFIANAPNNRIDSLVLTHPDRDHVNKLGIVLGANLANIQNIYYGGRKREYDQNPADAYNLVTSAQGRGMPVIDGRPHPVLSRTALSPPVNVYVLSGSNGGDPNGPPRDSVTFNPSSITLLVEYAKDKILLMGDSILINETQILNTPQLNALLTPPCAPNTMVLKMGHHGSSGSSGPAWMARVVPNICVVSSGLRSFGGSYIPAFAKLNVLTSPPLTNTSQTHSWCAWNNAMPVELGSPLSQFVTSPTVTNGIWTTLYKVAFKLNPGKRKADADSGLWWEHGQTWSYGTQSNDGTFALSWHGPTAPAGD